MSTLKLKNTKLADEYARPFLFYHTTDAAQSITRFHPLTHFGTKKAAQMRGIHLAYKELGITEPNILPNELPLPLQKKLHATHPNLLTTYQVYLHLKSPLKIKDFAKHDLQNYHQQFSQTYSPKSIYLTPKECRERDSLGIKNMPYKKAVSEFIFVHPLSQSIETLKKELASENLFAFVSANKQELAQRVAYQRMIRFLESEGYDGFVYVNDCEDVGQKSYIIFRPEQVFQKGETEHKLPQIDKENQLFLHKLEDDFFETKGMIAPYKRKELNRQIRAKHLMKLTK